MDTSLSIKEFWAENGYWVAENALTTDEVQELLNEAISIFRGEHGTDIGNYTPPPPEETDVEMLRRYLCIHFPHKISDVIHQYLAHPKIVDVLTQVIGPNVKCMQSMLFIKSGGKPGQAWHQDEDFIPTRDRSLTGAWMALDDATVENGCLWVIPGSHKYGLLWPMEVQNDPRFDCSAESGGFPFKNEDAIPVEVPAGSVVFFNGYLLHRSLPNYTKDKFRRALVNHYMSAESLLPWHRPEEGQGMALADYRDIVMVAGSDPYAYKGTKTIRTPHLRRDGNGGCDNGVAEKPMVVIEHGAG